MRTGASADPGPPDTEPRPPAQHTVLYTLGATKLRRPGPFHPTANPARHPMKPRACRPSHRRPARLQRSRAARAAVCRARRRAGRALAPARRMRRPAGERRPAQQPQHVQLDGRQRAHGAARQRREARGRRQPAPHLLVLGGDPEAGQGGGLPRARRAQRLNGRGANLRAPRGVSAVAQPAASQHPAACRGSASPDSVAWRPGGGGGGGGGAPPPP